MRMQLCLWLIDTALFLMPRGAYRRNLMKTLLAFDEAVNEKVRIADLRLTP